MGAELASKLAIDAGAAAITALAVAPLIAAFDEAITRSAAGENLWAALGCRLGAIVTNPAEYFTSVAFKWMWMVYAATYLASNGLKSVQSVTGINLGFAATVMVTMVNMSCGIAKDAAYANLFGTKGATNGGTSTPTKAYITWFLRDLIAFTFILTLPPIVEDVVSVPEDLAKDLEDLGCS